MNTHKVYRLTFPNGATYYGESQDPKRRWKSGWGYRNQPAVWGLIHKYGWGEVKKDIIAEFDNLEPALQYETRMIQSDFNSINRRVDTTHEGHERSGINPSHKRNISTTSHHAKKFIKYINKITNDRTETVSISRCDNNVHEVISFIMHCREDESRQVIFPHSLITGSEIIFFNDTDWNRLMSI